MTSYPVKGGLWELPAGFQMELEQVYGPTVVRQELQKARLWLLASPRRWKTAGGMRRFLVGWLNRAGSPQLVEDIEAQRARWAFDCPHTPLCRTAGACLQKSKVHG